MAERPFLGHFTPALQHRIEAAGFVWGSGSLEVWLVGRAELLRDLLAPTEDVDPARVLSDAATLAAARKRGDFDAFSAEGSYLLESCAGEVPALVRAVVQARARASELEGNADELAKLRDEVVTLRRDLFNATAAVNTWRTSLRLEERSVVESHERERKKQEEIDLLMAKLDEVAAERDSLASRPPPDPIDLTRALAFAHELLALPDHLVSAHLDHHAERMKVRISRGKAMSVNDAELVEAQLSALELAAGAAIYALAAARRIAHAP